MNIKSNETRVCPLTSLPFLRKVKAAFSSFSQNFSFEAGQGNSFDVIYDFPTLESSS